MFLPGPRMLMKSGCECGSCLARGCRLHNLSQFGQVPTAGTIPWSVKLAVARNMFKPQTWSQNTAELRKPKHNNKSCFVSFPDCSFLWVGC